LDTAGHAFVSGTATLQTPDIATDRLPKTTDEKLPFVLKI